MKLFVKIAATALGVVNALSASNLPVPTPVLQDFEYTSNSTFTGYSPGGATVSLFNTFLLLYGTPIGLGSARKLELIDVSNADVCYSTSCPSTTALYPQPNYVLNVGQLLFTPNDIQSGTGVTTVNTDFPVVGNLNTVGGPPPGVNISAEGMPVLYTGDDPGGTSSYAYFRNADGTVSNTLHVLRNTAGSAFLDGVILDPPGTLTLDILGFSNPTSNSFVTPEPASGQLGSASIAILAAVFLRRRPAIRRGNG